MRRTCGVVLCLLTQMSALQAQSPRPVWHLTAGVGALHFAATAHQIVPAPSPIDLRPTGRLGLHLGIQRRLGVWGVGAGVHWASGNVEALTDAIAIRDRSIELSRYRFALDLERRLGQMGPGELIVAVAPSLDLWALSRETRVRTAMTVAAALRIPLGSGLELENRLTYGLSASPLEENDVGKEFELRALRALDVGAGVRLGF